MGQEANLASAVINAYNARTQRLNTEDLINTRKAKASQEAFDNELVEIKGMPVKIPRKDVISAIGTLGTIEANKAKNALDWYEARIREKLSKETNAIKIRELNQELLKIENSSMLLNSEIAKNWASVEADKALAGQRIKGKTPKEPVLTYAELRAMRDDALEALEELDSSVGDTDVPQDMINKYNMGSEASQIFVTNPDNGKLIKAPLRDGILAKDLYRAWRAYIEKEGRISWSDFAYRFTMKPPKK